jgi:hypothetical protein
MNRPVYYRQARTPHSEQYQVMDGERRLGHLDLHFGAFEVYGTLVLDQEMPEDDVLRLIEAIDEDLVESAEVQRDDFLVRVYVGKEFGVGLYSDEFLADELTSDGHDGVDNGWDQSRPGGR